MSDPVERAAAIEAVSEGCQEWRGIFSRCEANLLLLPSAEPDIIRCKDCKHYNAGFECLIEGYGIERDKEWYCGDAERREE